MAVLFPDIHRAAEHIEKIIRCQGRNGLAAMEHHPVEGIAVLAQEVAEAARVIIIHVLEKQNPSGHCSTSLLPLTGGNTRAAAPQSLRLRGLHCVNCPSGEKQMRSSARRARLERGLHTRLIMSADKPLLVLTKSVSSASDVVVTGARGVR